MTRRSEQLVWDRFDPELYAFQNYSQLWPEDRAILHRLAVDVAPLLVECRVRNVVDVGAGSNLYPALAVLPFVDRIELDDIAEPNLAWLAHEVRAPGPRWDPFWSALGERDPRYHFDFRRSLAEKVSVLERSVFEQPEAAFDCAVMFFVAESITTEYEEFVRATRSACAAVRPGGLFVAAYMRRSKGYAIGDVEYPAVSVDVEDIEVATRDLVGRQSVEVLTSDHVIREGYDGIVFQVALRADGGG